MSTQRSECIPGIVNKQGYGKLISHRQTPPTCSDVEKEKQLGRGHGSWERQGSKESCRAGRNSGKTGWQEERDLGWGTTYSQAVTRPRTNEEKKLCYRIKLPALWGLISFCICYRFWLLDPWEGRTWDVGGGHRQTVAQGKPALQPGSLLQKEPPGRVWVRQLSKEVRGGRMKR